MMGIKIHDTLKANMGTSKHLPMPSTILKKPVPHCPHQVLQDMNGSCEHAKNVHQPFSPSPETKQALHTLDDKKLACVPIVTNGKYMGVIVAEEDYFTDDTLSHPETHLTNEKQSPHDAVPLDTVKKVVHEIKTPLSIIKNYLHILGCKLSNHSIAHDEIRIIQDEINRISHLLTQLQTAAVNRTEPAELVDINAQLTDLFHIMEEPLKKYSNVKLKLDIEDGLPMVRAAKGGIKQIFVNLINNSIDAMPKGGELFIRTKYNRQPGDSSNQTLQESQEHLEIIVSDNGVGIPSKIRHRIFEPFITSKANNHSGLGLSVVQDIVRSLDGTIRCAANKNRGTTFKISIPVQTPVHFPSEVHA